MAWNIDKTIEFCYGHRVWTQQLNGEYADDLKCACRHLHGHEAKVQVFMSADTLDQNGMVTDFRHLEWLKKFMNQIADHRFIIDSHDPIFSKVTGREDDTDGVVAVYVPGTRMIAGWEFIKRDETGADLEHLESFFIVNFVPTSENLSKWVYEMTQEKMKGLGVKVTRVDWWETPKSRSSYVASDWAQHYGE